MDEQCPEILAMMKKNFRSFKPRTGGNNGGGNGGWKGADRQTRPPPRDAKDIKCANCNMTGHDKDACTKPKLSISMRACHECGEVGHIGKNCPKKKRGTINAIQGESRQAKSSWVMCIGDQQSEEVNERRLANRRAQQHQPVTVAN